jgi:cobalt-zinc-cadmium efflux system outer membrane protein
MQINRLRAGLTLHSRQRTGRTLALFISFPILLAPHGGRVEAKAQEEAKSQTAPVNKLLLPGQRMMQQPQAAPAPQTQAEPMLRLEDLERLALRNNPTLAQAEAAVRAAEGRRVQAGLYPNPIVGYAGEELSFRAFSNKSEHFFFVEQDIITAGKLKKSRAVFAREKAKTEAEAEAQRLRVLNSVRLLYYAALGAQQSVELRERLAKLAREAVGISGELFNIGQADRPDVLESEVEAERAALELMRAETERQRVWQLLAAVVGEPALKPARLAGELEAEAPRLNPEEMLTTLLRDSPEVKGAQAGLARARAALVRAKAEPKPDLFVRGGIGYSTEALEPFGGKTGLEARVEVGVRLPLFDRNQGNIAAAQAEVTAAEREVQRVELALRMRLTEAFARYFDALGVAGRYQRNILPRAQQAYDLYLASFKQMAASYPQVLIAQRTLFQARTEYLAALVEMWQSVTHIRGLLLVGGLDVPSEARTESGAAGASSGDK